MWGYLILFMIGTLWLSLSAVQGKARNNKPLKKSLRKRFRWARGAAVLWGALVLMRFAQVDLFSWPIWMIVGGVLFAGSVFFDLFRVIRDFRQRKQSLERELGKSS